MADYWGVQKPFPLMDVSKGVSLVLVNSAKGKEVWDYIKSHLVYEISTINDAVKINPNVVGPTKEPSLRKDFFRILETEGYEQMVKTYLVCPEKMRNRRINRIMFLRRLYIYQPYEAFKRYVKFILIKLKLK